MLKWRVKEVAAAKGVSLKELAQRSGVSSSTIRRICQKPFQCSCKVTTWDKLAKALEVPLSAILESVPSNEQEKQMAIIRKHETGELESKRRSNMVAERRESI